MQNTTTPEAQPCRLCQKVMGIVNVNDESFYAASRCTTEQLVAKKIEQIISEGAEIIDIGACSTRPGSTPVSQEQEWQNLQKALHFIRGELNNPGSVCHTFFTSHPMRHSLSIDTFRSGIVQLAYDTLGEFTVNDISAGEDDPSMLPLVGRLNLPYIAMHKRGNPNTMQQLCSYENGVVNEVIGYFRKFGTIAADYGINEFIIDPGFGFAKTVGQNYELLSATRRIKEQVREGIGKDVKILIGLSRKSMIYKPLGISPEEALCGTAALNLQALMLGADIIRVHDVAEGVQCIKLAELLRQSKKD